MNIKVQIQNLMEKYTDVNIRDDPSSTCVMMSYFLAKVAVNSMNPKFLQDHHLTNSKKEFLETIKDQELHDKYDEILSNYIIDRLISSHMSKPETLTMIKEKLSELAIDTTEGIPSINDLIFYTNDEQKIINRFIDFFLFK
jgi:hypothetical protein